MTISDRRGADKPEILFQERIAKLEKVNQALRTEILECKSSESVMNLIPDSRCECSPHIEHTVY